MGNVAAEKIRPHLRDALAALAKDAAENGINEGDVILAAWLGEAANVFFEVTGPLPDGIVKTGFLTALAQSLETNSFDIEALQ